MTTATDDSIASPHIVEPTDGPLTWSELGMAYRCPAMPLDALRYERTPTGLHYQVVHFQIPGPGVVDGTVTIGGQVRRRLELSLADIRGRPRTTRTVTLECAGNGRALFEPRPVSGPWLTGGVSTAQWTGTPLRPLLEEAGLGLDAVDVAFTGADRGIQGGEEQDYARGLSVADALGPDVMLAYEMNGQPLEPQHGAPLRLLVPGWYGMASVKWLRSIEVIDHPFRGFQNEVAYRYQDRADDPGEPVTTIRVKSLLAPPGIAEFISERHIVDSGTVTLTGRAWSGTGSIERVEVGIDGEWSEARLHEPIDARAWRGWSYEWEAQPGEHVLSCRATDSAGNIQPKEQPWNYQGMGNNTVQELGVVVR